MGWKLVQNIIDKLRGKKHGAYKIDWHDEKKYKENICKAYYNAFREKLNLNNPKNFSEKMQWLRVYDNTPLKTQLADKYLVREWVKEKIGEEYLIPLLGVYDNFDEIDFEKLPNQFVLQCNHGCGYNIIVKDKSSFDIENARNKVNTWMNENYAYRLGEWHYKGIKRKIIISKYLEFGFNGSSSEYKVFCFNGTPKFCLFEVNQHGINKRAVYDTNFNRLPFKIGDYCEVDRIEKQCFYAQMIKLASILAKDFLQVRVDFYVCKNKIYFGEMTFTSGGGYSKFNPPEWNEKLGELLDLGKTVANSVN